MSPCRKTIRNEAVQWIQMTACTPFAEQFPLLLNARNSPVLTCSSLHPFAASKLFGEETVMMSQLLVRAKLDTMTQGQTGLNCVQCDRISGRVCIQ